jgi:hypothetical protein
VTIDAERRADVSRHSLALKLQATARETPLTSLNPGTHRCPS